MIKRILTVAAVVLCVMAIGAGLADFAGNFRIAKSLSFGASTLTSAAGRVTFPASTGSIVVVSGTGKITSLVPSANMKKGSLIYLYHSSTDTLVDGVNLKLAGDFNGTADDILVLMYGKGTITTAADTFFTEVSRSAN